MLERFLCFFLLVICLTAHATNQDNLKLINDMFNHVSEAMTLNKVNNYFTMDFVLESNRQILDYKQFKEHLAAAFENLRTIQVQRPFADTMNDKDKVMVRGKIITVDKKNKKYVTDFIAIFQIKDHKINRWWELTYPDWSTKQ